MSDHSWFVLRCVPHREIETEKRIRRFGFEAMVPYVDGRRRVHKTPRPWRYPLFPGYVFASWPDWSEGWSQVADENTGIAWVYDFLKPSGLSLDPSILKPGDVAYLKSIADGKYRADDAVERLVVGDRVLVPDGLLQGLPSTIVKIKRGKKATLKVSEEKNAVYLEKALADLVKL